MKRKLIHIFIGASLVAAIATADTQMHCHMPTKSKTTTPATQPANGTMAAIPNVKVTTQDGKTVDFYNDLIKGKVVAVNFVFTTCTTVCPPMGALFGNLQKQNADRVGKDTFLVSVSIDPANDTPERLKAWSKKFGAREGWTLVTGSKENITSILKAMNVYVPNFADHQPVTIIGNDTTGEWKRTYGFSSASKLTQMIDQVRNHKEHAE